MTPTLPFYLPTAASLCPPPLGIAAFNHYGATIPPASRPSNARHAQPAARSAESVPAHPHAQSRRSSGDERNMQHFDRSTGTKNGKTTAEAYNPPTQPPNNNSGNNNTNSGNASAAATQNSGPHRIMSRYNREGNRLYSTKQRNHVNDQDYEDSGTTMFNKLLSSAVYHGNGSATVSGNTPKTLAPPLLKVIDLDDRDTSSEKWIQRVDRQESCELDHRQQQADLQTAPLLKNAEVISTVIKRWQPHREIIYVDREECNGLDEFSFRNGEQTQQRSRVTNSESLSSGDDSEAPDSPCQLSCNGLGQSTYYSNKLSCRDGHYNSTLTSKRDSSAVVNHKILQYNKSLRKKSSSSLLRCSNHHHSVVPY